MHLYALRRSIRALGFTDVRWDDGIVAELAESERLCRDILRPMEQFMETNSQCGNCNHLAREEPGYSCPAFPGPDGVPDDIIFNIFAHTKPYPGQADPAILFSPVDSDYPLRSES